MNLDFYSDPIEKEIVTEVMRWSEEVLSIPSPFLNNLPPCPYAKKSLLEQKTALLFKKEDNYQQLYSCISQFDDNFELAIIIDLANDKTAEEFHEYFHDLNEAISNGMFIDKDIWVMGFHPDDEPSEFVEEVTFDYENETTYCMIFVQRLSVVQKAADKLNKKGYYASYSDEYDAEDIYEIRNQLYRRLKNGDET